MAHINESTGKLVPTGKTYPQTGVRVAISHEVLENSVGGQHLKQNKTIIHSVTPQNGEVLQSGDFDLVMGDQLIRLKKLANSPEWVVLSSYTS